ncbi:MAG: hypothetical protein J6Q48_07385 [Bacteroidaceae bacterium]|nr:hypothetical protein [Bacteroidaceae bacterium]
MRKEKIFRSIGVPFCYEKTIKSGLRLAGISYEESRLDEIVVISCRIFPEQDKNLENFVRAVFGSKKEV